MLKNCVEYCYKTVENKSENDRKSILNDIYLLNIVLENGFFSERKNLEIPTAAPSVKLHINSLSRLFGNFIF